MNLNLVSVHHYALPLLRPIVVGGRSISSREGIFVTVERKGHYGFGEVAPLPGLHTQSMDDCIVALRAGWPLVEDGDAWDRDGRLDVAALYRQLLPLADIQPVHLGLAMAVLTVAAACQGTTPAELMGTRPLTHVPVNGLVTGKPGEWHDAVHALYGQGFRTVKVKVGRSPLAEEKRAFDELTASRPGDLALILDGNRAWTPDEAAAFFEAIDCAGISYAEEVLRNPDDLPGLQARTGVAMALDETLADVEAHADLVRDWDSVVVLKPDRIRASVQGAAFLAARARTRHQKAVVSSSFQSPVGLSFLAHAAAAMQVTHAGLDTARGFEDPGVRAAFPIKDGVLDVATCRVRDLDAYRAFMTEVDLGVPDPD